MYLRRRGGRLTAFIAEAGTRLRIDGTHLYEAESPVGVALQMRGADGTEWIIHTYRATRVRLTGSGEAQWRAVAAGRTVVTSGPPVQ